MSWGINFVGKPENVAKAIESYGEQLTGQCKVEYDAAKPHMIGLVQQNFVSEAGKAQGWKSTLVQIEAGGSGSATTADGDLQRSCAVNVKPIYGTFCE